MLIQVIDGSLIGYQHFIFPDGQRHITLATEIEYSDILVTTSLCSADDIFDLLLVKEILDNGHNKTSLRINYLLGARMDRRIDNCQPFTLKVVADIINSAHFEQIEILDPHSNEVLRCLHDGLFRPPKVVYPLPELRRILRHYNPGDTVIVIPDAGATERVSHMLVDSAFELVQCRKNRDSKTGRLYGSAIDNPNAVTEKRCLIIDDICDAGGTFVGLAKLLREAGAVSVDLFVTHGIFSKGRGLEGIDNVYSTHSFTGKIHPKQETAQRA